MGKGKWWQAPVIFLGAAVLVAVGVAVYVFLTRLSPEVLAILATVGCAAGVALPSLLVALVVLLRRVENGNGRRREPPQATMTQPAIMVVPPMALPQPPTQTQPLPATWETTPAPRRFVVVGEE
jgi:hypothetical protein